MSEVSFDAAREILSAMLDGGDISSLTVGIDGENLRYIYASNHVTGIEIRLYGYRDELIIHKLPSEFGQRVGVDVSGVVTLGDLERLLRSLLSGDEV